MQKFNKLSRAEMKNVVGGVEEPPCNGCVDCYQDAGSHNQFQFIGVVCGVNCVNDDLNGACATVGGYPGPNCWC